MEAAARDRSDGSSTSEKLAAEVSEPASEVKDASGRDEDKPLGSHLALVVLYNALVGGFLAARIRSGKGFPKRIAAADLLLAGVATHKISRTIAKDRVTAPLRAPFTEFQADGGPGEVEERARGTGMRRAIGQLLVCPFCLSQWVATGLLAGLATVPRTTRFICSIFAAVTISDFLQIFYKGSEEKLL
jgi:Protein of unknown function (DUF1360)